MIESKGDTGSDREGKPALGFFVLCTLLRVVRATIWVANLAVGETYRWPRTTGKAVHGLLVLTSRRVVA